MFPSHDHTSRRLCHFLRDFPALTASPLRVARLGWSSGCVKQQSQASDSYSRTSGQERREHASSEKGKRQKHRYSDGLTIAN